MEETQETQVWSLDREDPLEKEMATHSIILAWRIPRPEEPGGLWSMGSQRVGHNWVTNTFSFTNVVNYISVTYLFYNWKFLPHHLPHLFYSSLYAISLWQPLVFSLHLWICFCFVCSIISFLKNSTHKWNHLLLVFLCRFVQLSMVPTRSISVVKNGKSPVIFMTE